MSPRPTYSAPLRRQMAGARADDVVLWTLELSHASWTAPVRVVHDLDNLTATLEADAPRNAGEQVTFLACPFSLILPRLEDGDLPEITVAVDNVSREIMPQIMQAVQVASAVEVIVRPYLLSELSQPHMDPPLTMTLASVTANVFRVEAKARNQHLAAYRWPRLRFTADGFPGLVRSS